MEKRKIKDLKRGDYFTLTPVKEPNISQLKYGSEENTFLRLNATVHTNERTSIMK
jgi:hypothetical protein